VNRLELLLTQIPVFVLIGQGERGGDERILRSFERGYPSIVIRV